MGIQSSNAPSVDTLHLMPPAPTHAHTHQSQPATGSLCPSRSNNSSLPSFCEYSRFKILNHVLCPRSVAYGVSLFFATPLYTLASGPVVVIYAACTFFRCSENSFFNLRS